MLDGHGDDIYGKSVVANFSTNVWYGSDTSWMEGFIKGCWETILHYPEPTAASLAAVVAEYHNIDSRRVLVGNGATELFYLIAERFRGAKTAIMVPSFAEYEDACTLCNHSIEFIPNSTPLGQIKGSYDLLFICNPNNPDGHIYSEGEIRLFVEANRETTIVIDEAFVEFTTAVNSSDFLLNSYDNIIIVRSMTKSYSIPGLRLGYLLSSGREIERLLKFKQPWSVNSIAIEMGKHLLTDRQQMLPNSRLLMDNQAEFRAAIDSISGFRARGSAAPFFLVESRWPIADLKSYLLEEWGVLIRDAGNFRELDGELFRVNTLEEHQIKILIDALKAFSQSVR